MFARLLLLEDLTGYEVLSGFTGLFRRQLQYIQADVILQEVDLLSSTGHEEP